jgi:hypothetical protein
MGSYTRNYYRIIREKQFLRDTDHVKILVIMM